MFRNSAYMRTPNWDKFVNVIASPCLTLIDLWTAFASKSHNCLAEHQVLGSWPQLIVALLAVRGLYSNHESIFCRREDRLLDATSDGNP